MAERAGVKDEAIREAALAAIARLREKGRLQFTTEGAIVDLDPALRMLWLKAEAETARRCAEIAVVNHADCGPPCNSAVAERRVQEAIRSEFGLGEGKV